MALRLILLPGTNLKSRLQTDLELFPAKSVPKVERPQNEWLRNDVCFLAKSGETERTRIVKIETIRQMLWNRSIDSLITHQAHTSRVLQ